jgi:hypothetical protein
MSGPALGPVQAPIQWAWRAERPGREASSPVLEMNLILALRVLTPRCEVAVLRYTRTTLPLVAEFETHRAQLGRWDPPGTRRPYHYSAAIETSL